MRPALEVADILRAHGAAYQANHRVSAEQAAVMRHLVTCRTAALGGHVDACDQCGFQRVSYNSCRDRHCPKCQAANPPCTAPVVRSAPRCTDRTPIMTSP